MGAAQILKFDLEQQMKRKNVALQHKSIAEKVDDIYNSSVLLLQILSTSLQISSSEMGGVHLQGSEFNMLELVETICSVFSSIAVDRGISLQSFIDIGNIPDMIYGDNTRVSQILMNFVSNSLKYTPNKGSVTVKCTVSTQEELDEFRIDKKNTCELMMCYPAEKLDVNDLIFITFTCADSGCGMNSNQIINLFSSNQQANPSMRPTSRARRTGNDQFIESHGFGLKISKHLIDLMNGKIQISSEIGKGTAIKIIIPFFKQDKKGMILEEQIEQLRNISKEKELSQVTVSLQDQNRILIKYLEYLLPNNVVIIESDVEREESMQVKTIDRNCSVSLLSKGDTTSLNYETLFLARPFKVKDIISVLIESMSGDCEINSSETGSEITKIRSSRSLDSFTCNILVVDDNSINRKVVHRLLQIIGYENIDFAVDGLQAFEKFKLSNFQFVLMDLEMPNMNGKESCELMRKFEMETKRNRAEIFAVTGDMTQSMATCADFDNILFKPISKDSLSQMLTLNKNTD